jgi:hypothetical protein
MMRQRNGHGLTEWHLPPKMIRSRRIALEDSPRSAKLTGRTLRLRGKVDAILAEQYFAIPDPERRIIRTINVEDAQNVYNNGILPIAADLLRITSHPLRIYGATSGYLKRLFDLYNWRWLIENRSAKYHFRNPLAVIRYANDKDVNEYVTRCMNEVTRRFICSKDIVKGFEWSFNEILGNVLDHANSDLGGFSQMTYFKPSKRLNMIVLDVGRGLKDSLSETHLNIIDDRAAIALAIQKGVTRNTRIGQGNGLWGTTQIVKAVGGNLRIWSGAGNLWVSADGEEHYNTAPYFHGTLVEWQLPTDRSFSLQAAIEARIDPYSKFFEDYEPVPGEVRFVLQDEASNFGNRPIGRQLSNKVLTLAHQSEAKRCVVDFKNVRIISSSFADEFLGKLAEALGDKFGDFIQLDHISEDNRVIVEKAIRERLAVRNALRRLS